MICGAGLVETNACPMVYPRVLLPILMLAPAADIT